MAAKFRIPGLQVPSSADPETRAFFEAVKERFELSSGERGDASARAVRASELEGVRFTVRQQAAARGSSSTTVQDLDFSVYESRGLGTLSGDLNFLVQGISVTERFKVPVSSIVSLFPRVDQEIDIQATWSFIADGVGLDIQGVAPRFRYFEKPAEDEVETSLPTDSAIWDQYVDAGVMHIVLRNDDDDTDVDVVTYGRSGVVADYANFHTTALEHLGEQVITQPGHGLDKTSSASDALDVDETELDHSLFDNLTVGDPHTQYALRRVPITHQTADYVATPDDSTITVDATAGPVTISLPPIASSLGVKLTIKKTDSSANVVTVDADGTETIDSVESLTIVTQNGLMHVHAGATEWHLV